ncbi:hypothetical protein Sjap_023845 [Stephania japonica]|uniref:ABC transporter domain-containing protein n=1 Tax=Stephania japonica TaxID=461633 RepID=A0AAP0EJN6_9MAGN
MAETLELESGFRLLWEQFRALLKKNLLLSWRHKRSTLVQLFSPLFFIFLIFCIQKAIDARLAETTAFQNVFDPKTLSFPAIPPCEGKFFTKTPCFDFAWSGNASAAVRSVVRRIMDDNPGRPIPSAKVKSFGTPEEVDDWLFSDPMRCHGAIHFVERNATFISYGIQTNSTLMSSRGRREDNTFKFQIPLQLAAERATARILIGDPNFRWSVGLKEFAHPALRSFSAMSLVGPTFFLAIAMFGFVFQMGSLVAEKELKLRQAMSMMGLYETSYWLSWLIWEAFVTLLSSVLTVLFGMMFQFNFFLHNSFVVLLLLFFLFQLNMIGFAFFMSTFLSKSSSATTIGFCTFIIGFLTQLVTTFGFPYNDIISKHWRVIWSLFPPNLLAKALDQLADATATPEGAGISWSRIAECPSTEFNCVITIGDIYKWLLSTFFVWFLLAIYFDNVIPNSFGMRKSLFYFLKIGYWMGKDGHKVEEGCLCSCRSSIPPLDDVFPDDDDVLDEEVLVKKQVTEDAIDPNVAVQIRGLAKTYPGTTNLGCCKCKRTSPYHAVKDLWANFMKNQLFCLLGPNGAGKTTVINCLTGMTPVTSGDALIYGYFVRSSVGMSCIRRFIGVCPQFDILWDSLSGQEHLCIFASIKGLSPGSIELVVENSLAEVKLTSAAKVRVGRYSGGMKRRLSVAIALIGNPKLVFLDEPTTGMDPITRRHVWDIIENAKKERAIILTTHSMEEADILGDRIAIMAKGKLRCIGTSIRLKSRFGTGFVTNVSFVGTNHGQSPSMNGDAAASEYAHYETVKEFFKSHLDVTPKEESKMFLTFIIPHEKEGLLADFFSELQERVEEFGIADIQLGLTTLEEVFLNIAKKAELENAVAEGAMVTLTLSTGAELTVPKGARYIGIPGTESAVSPRGLMVEVYWERDESGSLCISGHSPQTPIPLHVPPMACAATPRRNFFGKNAPIRGFVISPDEIDGRNDHR